MSTDRWVSVDSDGIYMHIDNDGWTFMRHGSEETRSKIRLADEISTSAAVSHCISSHISSLFEDACDDPRVADLLEEFLIKKAALPKLSKKKSRKNKHDEEVPCWENDAQDEMERTFSALEVDFDKKTVAFAYSKHARPDVATDIEGLIYILATAYDRGWCFTAPFDEGALVFESDGYGFASDFLATAEPAALLKKLGWTESSNEEAGI